MTGDPLAELLADLEREVGGRVSHVALPEHRPDGTFACCGGYGEHFATCHLATWERREL